MRSLLESMLPYSASREWQKRARLYGARAVVNLSHGDQDLQAVTEAQKKEVFPFLKNELNGSEKLVLDLGCGTGRFTADLARLTGGQVIGMDVVRPFLDLAPAQENISYQLMKEGRIEMPDGSADLVWVCLVLGGLQSGVLFRTAREIRRVLKKNGLLFLVENTSVRPSPRHWKFRPIAEYQALFPDIPLKHLHDYTDVGETVSVLAGRKAA